MVQSWHILDSSETEIFEYFLAILNIFGHLVYFVLIWYMYIITF
jgi:hypothetical protein